MSIFTAIVPRLTRTFGHRGRDGGAESRETEFSLKPAYEIKESDEAWALTVQLPGVARDGLEFTAEEGLITLRARRAWQQPEGWTALYRESADAPYTLVLEHDSSVDVDKIHAELKDGVLRVSLLKVEAVKPRQIVIH